MGPDRKTKLVRKDKKWSEERKEIERKTMLGDRELYNLQTLQPQHRQRRTQRHKQNLVIKSMSCHGRKRICSFEVWSSNAAS